MQPSSSRANCTPGKTPKTISWGRKTNCTQFLSICLPKLFKRFPAATERCIWNWEAEVPTPYESVGAERKERCRSAPAVVYLCSQFLLWKFTQQNCHSQTLRPLGKNKQERWSDISKCLDSLGNITRFLTCCFSYLYVYTHPKGH